MSYVTVLPNNKMFSYVEYGDPLGYPVLFFHGFIGSCYQASLAHMDAFRQGLRIISPSRPGVGKSETFSCPRVVDAILAYKTLIDLLQIKKCAVLGVSGGAPYALAFMHEFPKTVSSAALVSSLGPVEERQIFKALRRREQGFFFLAKHFPFITRAIVKRKKKQLEQQTAQQLQKFIRSLPMADHQVCQRKFIHDMLLIDHCLTFNNKPPQTIVDELNRLADWGFSAGNVSADIRVDLWHGEDDTFVPLDCTQFLAQKMPHAIVRTRPGGHFMIVDHIQEILSVLK